MRAFAVVIAFVVAAGCSTSSPHVSARPAIHVHEHRSYFVDDAAPSQEVLQHAVDAAIAGDDAKLAYVISLIRFTDGEGAENYGGLLLDLRVAIAASRFDQVLLTLDPHVRDSAQRCMKVAEELRGYARGHQKT